jgi:hypothetical protein
MLEYPSCQVSLTLSDNLSSILRRNRLLPLDIALESRDPQHQPHHRLLKRQLASALLVKHARDGGDDAQPIRIIRDDRAVRRRVLPAQQSLEHIPSVVDLRVAAVDMPHRLPHVVRAGPTALLRDIAAHLLGEGVELQTPDGFREHARGDQVQHAGGRDQEQLDRHDVPAAVDEEADEQARQDAGHDGQRERRRGQAERDAADEDDGLDALAHRRDEGEEEHGVAAREGPQPRRHVLVPRLVDQGLGDLDAPLLLGLVDPQQREAHDGDDEGRDEVEDALPEILGLGPDVLAQAVEDADEGAADDQTDGDAPEGAEPDLAAELLIDDLVLLGLAEALLEEGEEDGDDDDGLEDLAKDDEEDLGGEHVRHREAWWAASKW